MKKIVFSLISVLLTLSFVFVTIPAMGATYEYTTWKQTDSRWGSIEFGNVGDTVAKSGCAVTSIAILMVHSGAVSSDPTVFNPGIFVNWLKNNGGFTSQGWLYWSKASEYTSKFYFDVKVNLSGLTKQKKIDEIDSYIKKGYVIVAEVNSGGHYVAIDRVENNIAYMFDPADRGYDDLFDYAESGVLSIRLFKGPNTGITSGGDIKPNLTPGKMGTGTYVITSDDGLNIRSGADTSYSKIGAIPYNTTTYVSNVVNNWGNITYDGVTGWISLQYAKMTTPDYIDLQVTPPTKLEYEVGEALDTTGMTVTAVYSDNTTKKLTNEYTVAGYEDVAGTHTITVAYNGRGATFDIMVKGSSSSVDGYQLGTYKILSDDGMNVRKEATTNSEVLGAVPYNTEFTVTKISGDWGYTTVNGLTGWINLKYSKFISPLEEVFTLEVETYRKVFLVNNRIPSIAFTVYKVKDGVKTQTNEYTIMNYDYTTPGEKVITVTLNEKKAEFTVEYFDKVPTGDTNFDGEIASLDALTVLQYSVGKIDNTQIYLDAADIDKNGEVDARDALSILQFSVGKIKF